MIVNLRTEAGKRLVDVLDENFGIDEDDAARDIAVVESEAYQQGRDEAKAEAEARIDAVVEGTPLERLRRTLMGKR